mgnify:CR=1 FL=1
MMIFFLYLREEWMEKARVFLWSKVLSRQRWAWVIILGLCLWSPQAQAGERIANMLSDGNGCVLLLTLDRNLYRFCPDDSRPQLQDQLPARPFGAGLDRQERLLLATDKGIFRKKKKDKQWERIPGAPRGGAWIRCFPGLGCLTWVWSKGLYRIGTQGLQEMEQTGLPDSPVLDICQTADGSLWAAFFGSGVFCLRSGEERWQPANSGLSSRHVLALTRDSRNRLYVGTFGGGLQVLSPKEPSWQTVPSLQAFDITAVALGPADEHRILAGTRKQGLWWSRDGGQTWTSETGITGTVSSLLWTGEKEALAAEESGVLYQRHGGARWRAITLR